MSANFDRSSSGGADETSANGANCATASPPSSSPASKPHKFDFFQKRRSVAPVSNFAAAAIGDEISEAPEALVFLNQPSEFDFRALFRRAGPTSSAVGDTPSPSPPQPQPQPDKRRLRAREELCLMAARSQNRAKKSWFLSHGYIGRDSGEHTVVVTKDVSMDPIHAEVLIDGDDYLIRDCGSSSGTFLCLNTINRHHPQRDGYRLRNGDTFELGQGATIVVHEVCTGPKQVSTSDPHELSNRTERRVSIPSTTDTECDDADGVEGGDGSGGGAASSSTRRVRFGAAVDAADGGPVVGNRYKRKKKKRTNSYEKRSPMGIILSITVDDQPICKELQLPGKDVYIIGSAPAACDIVVPASSVLPVHARIVFDGCFFLLQDLSFEENPQRKTRVALQQPTRVGRGDCLLFGTYVVHVVNVYRAFRDHEPDMREVAFRCHLLRSSKRKSRTKGKFIPFGFRHHTQDAFVFGKGRHCEGHIFTSALNVEQFAIQLDHGACSLVPRAAGINQGMYFLLGRDTMAHEHMYRSDLVRHTSKALMLVEGSVFKCGNTEVEVVYVKNESQASAAARADDVKENAAFISKMPWIQQIAVDRHGIENLAKRGQRLVLQPGDAIYDEGDAATFLFIVISGDVELVARGSDLPNTWRLSAIEGFLAGPNSTRTSLPESAPEHVPAGSYFGEICLRGDNLEYGESAKVASPCTLLALSRDDICGYLAHYMDIIEPHLAYESHKELLHKLRANVPWLEGFSYQDLRVLASKAEHACFEIGESIIEDGVFQINSTPRSGGLLLLGYGKALLVGSRTDPTDDGASDAAMIHELWSPSQPIVASDAIPIEPMFQNVQARSRVECFFFDCDHVAHLMKKTQGAAVPRESFTGAVPFELRRASTNRRSSFVGNQRKARHSQVVMTSAPGADDDDANLESADVEELSDPTQKWRRKKRNKNLLEKTVIETQQNEELPNAIVMYVLSGANRGDIHVVRNVASIGGILSDADIELNDRYVSRRQAVIEHRDGRFWLYDNLSEWGTLVRLEENQNIQVYPGDVFVAGEVEFTCLAAFPVRKKTQICCIQ